MLRRSMSTFVLVHGAFAGGWLWERVVPLLAAQGHIVAAPSLRGLGDRASEASETIGLGAHIDDVVDAMQGHARLVLVGFSYGGMVIGGAAERAPDRVSKLVYLDAFVPAPGRSMMDVVPPDVRASFETSVVEGWLVPPLPLDPLGRIEEGAGTEEQIRLRLARRCAQPLRTFTDRVGPMDRATAIPRVYVHCTDKTERDPMAPIANDAWAHGFEKETLDAGHFAAQTTPRAVAALLARLA
jgi:pimeloyl-ACP methyl ester carboxylesterase